LPTPTHEAGFAEIIPVEAVNAAYLFWLSWQWLKSKIGKILFMNHA